MNSIEEVFDWEYRDIPNSRYLDAVTAVKIKICLGLNFPGTWIDSYLNKSKGTVTRWKNNGILSNAIDRDLHPDCDPRIIDEIKRLVSKVGVNTTLKRNEYFLEFSRNNPIWVQTMFDIGADPNAQYNEVLVMFKVTNPETLQLYVDAGVTPLSSMTMVQQYYFRKSYLEMKDKSDSEANKRKYINVFADSGFDLSQFYRLMRTEPRIKNLRLIYWLLLATKQNVNVSESFNEVKLEYEQYLRERRKVLEDVLPFGTDLIWLIACALDPRTPYK